MIEKFPQLAHAPVVAGGVRELETFKARRPLPAVCFCNILCIALPAVCFCNILRRYLQDPSNNEWYRSFGYNPLLISDSRLAYEAPAFTQEHWMQFCFREVARRSTKRARR